MTTRELKDWEKCNRSPFTGAHGWELEEEPRMKDAEKQVVATRVRCKFCSSKPPHDEEARMYDWMYEFEHSRRMHHKIPFVRRDGV